MIDETSAWIEAHLPHEPPARLLVRVIEMSELGLTCVARIPADSPYATDGRAPAFLGIEIAAQAAALHETSTSQRANCAAIGYLVSARDVRMERPHLAVESPMRVAIRLTDRALELSHYEIEVDAAEGRVLSGSIGTYRKASATSD